MGIATFSRSQIDPCPHRLRDNQATRRWIPGVLHVVIHRGARAHPQVSALLSTAGDISLWTSVRLVPTPNLIPLRDARHDSPDMPRPRRFAPDTTAEAQNFDHQVRRL
ncbi:hypothetical protein GCM10027610_116790 [Dactylosporangium cerinum]